MVWKEWKDFASNETYWRNHLEKGLLKAEHVRDYVLRLWFEDEKGTSIYELDFYSLIIGENPGEAFLPLRDQKRFCFVQGDYALIWPNPETGEYDDKAVDLAPECVRFFCEKYGKKLNVSHPPTASKRSVEKQVALAAPQAR